MNDDGQEAWAHELMQERYRETCEALKQCAKAGADPQAIRTLARECGVDIKHVDAGTAPVAR